MRQATFEDLGQGLFETQFVVLDLETTGGSPASDSITEIGALKAVGGETVGTFQCLVRPDHSIAPYVELLTGITNEMVAMAPPIQEVLPNLWEFLRDSVIVCHNSPFDTGFLKAAFRRYGYEIPFKRSVCTLRLARWLLRGETRDMRLETLARTFNTENKPNHRAFTDAATTVEVFHRLLELAGPVGVLTVDDLLAFCRAGRRPDLTKASLCASIPRCSGVYKFLNRRGDVIYVGKAKDLRTRVRSYFYGDDRLRIGELVRDVAKIDVEKCRSPLEAEVRELRLIHQHQPRYNRRGKSRGKPAAWIRFEKRPVPRFVVTRAMKEDFSSVMGPFPHQRAAKEVLEVLRDAAPIARCADPLGHPFGCAFGQMGKCAAPCHPGSRDGYASLIAQVKESVESGGTWLLSALEERMHTYSQGLRFEEAGSMKDRIALLARYLHRRMVFESLTGAGDLIVSLDRDGVTETTFIRSGLLVEVQIGCLPEPERVFSFASVAPSRTWATLPEMEEMMIVWRYLEKARGLGAAVTYCSGRYSLTLDRIAS